MVVENYHRVLVFNWYLTRWHEGDCHDYKCLDSLTARYKYNSGTHSIRTDQSKVR